MDNERSAVINIGGTDYEMVLTVKATKAIGKRYGGLDKLGDQLMNTEKFEFALDEVVWLLTLLVNQSILIHNLKHKDDPQSLLTEEEVELLTSPMELATYKDAITVCMYRGTVRNVQSDTDSGESKNAQIG